MTVEALSLILCLASGIFGRPAWTPEKCQERAEQISKIAEQNDLDPMWFVAINIQECDMRENVNARFFAPVSIASKGKRKKPMQLGIDACPMGIRIWWPNGKRPEKPLDALALYDLAGRKMARLKRWCDKHLKGKGFGPHHHFVSHWNEGNPTYAAQVLAFKLTLMGKPPKSDEELTSRSKEIVRRLQRAQRASRWKHETLGAGEKVLHRFRSYARGDPLFVGTEDLPSVPSPSVGSKTVS